MTSDNSRIGALVVKDTSAWGFGPFYSRRGGEPGDYLSVVFNPSERVVVVQIGDASLADQLGDSEYAVDDPTSPTKSEEILDTTDSKAIVDRPSQPIQ